MDQLRRRLSELDAQYARKQAELNALEGQGVGGAGGAGTAGTNDAAVGVIYQGTISSVSTQARELNLKDADGRTLAFPITRQTRAYRNGRRVPIDSIRRGTPVRLSMDMVNIQQHGRRPIREILIVEPKKK